MIKPENYKEGSPDRKLAEFYKTWEERDWEAMVSTIQISWVEIMPKVKEALSQIFQYKLIDVVMVDSKLIADVTFAAHMKVSYYIARGVLKKMECDARVICETEPMTPSPDGTWGVNPNSVMVR